MSEEGDLGEDDAEGPGDQQLEPAVAEEDETGYAAADGQDQGEAHESVEPGGAAEEARFAHDARDIGEGVGHRGELGCSGIGGADGAETRLDDG